MADKRTVKIDILGDSKSAQNAFGAVEKSADGFGKKMADIGKIAAGFVIGQGIIKLPGLLMGGADAAIKLEANAKKAALVFGDSLGTVQKWAETSAAGMGLTNKEATTLAASMADLLIPMGFTREAAAGMSTDVLGLSGALAEWSGGQKSAADVAGILNKALLGEREELKGLGISITAADVAQRLLEKGQKDLTGAALQQAEAEATLELIFEKSKDAQTAYALSTDDLMSRKARLIAMVNTLKERFQMALLPVLTVVYGVFEDVAGVVQRVVNAFDSGGLLGALRELGTVAGEAASGVMGLAANLIDGLLNSLDNVADFGLRFASWITEQIGGVDWSGAASGAGTAILNGIIAGFGAATEFGARFVAWFTEAVTDIDYGEIGASVLNGIIAGWEATTDFGERFITWAVGVFQSVEWGELGQTILDGIITGYEAVTDFGQRVIDWMVSTFESVDWAALGQAILDGVITGFEAAQGWAEDFVAWFDKTIVAADWSAVGQSIVDKLNEAIAAADQEEAAASLFASLQPLIDRMQEDWTITIQNFKATWDELRFAIEDLSGVLLPEADLQAGFKGMAIMLGVVLVGPTVAFTELLRHLSGAILELVTAMAEFQNAANAVLVPAINFIHENLSLLTIFLTGDFQGAWKDTKQLLSDIWSASGIPGIVQTGIDAVKTSITDGMNDAKQAVSNVLTSIETLFTDAWGRVEGTVRGVTETITGLINGVISAINGVIGGYNSFANAFNALPDITLGGGSFMGVPIPSLTIGFPTLPTIGYLSGGGGSGLHDLGPGGGPGFEGGPGTGGGGGGPGGGGDPVKDPPKFPPVGSPGNDGGAPGTGGGVKPNPHPVLPPVVIDPVTGEVYSTLGATTHGVSGHQGSGSRVGANAFAGTRVYATGSPEHRPDSLGRPWGDPCWGKLASCEVEMAAAARAAANANNPYMYQGGGQGNFQTQSSLRDRDPAAYAAKHGGVLLKSGLVGYPASGGGGVGDVFLNGDKVGWHVGAGHMRRKFMRRKLSAAPC